jgi:glycosyltransferase involved in cell wall biosynthesis
VTVSARGNDVDMMMFPPGDFARLTWTLDRARVVTAASRDLAKKIDLLLDRDAEVIVVPNAVDTEIFSPGAVDPTLAPSLGISPDELVLGFSGELRHKKGLPFLLAALAEVRRHRPACLLVIGEVRAREHEHLVAFSSAQPEAAERIVVTGHVESTARVRDHLRLVDVFLLPSVWDGMPNALLEAMACERVVIASDAGGIPEIVDHGVDGLLVARHELHRLGEAVLEVAGLSAERRGAIGAAARKKIVDRMSSANEASALHEVLARLEDHASKRS